MAIGIDEGALFSQIGGFLSEDLGRGDITTQATVMPNARARGRFIAKETMIIAGLEAAEAVFSTLDAQQQLDICRAPAIIIVSFAMKRPRARAFGITVACVVMSPRT